MQLNTERIRYFVILKFLALIGKGNMSISVLKNPGRKDQQRLIGWVFHKYKNSEIEICNHLVFTYSPEKIKRHLHVIYFHGGAYILQGSFIHWLFLRNLMNRLSCRVSYIDYPLAPEHDYQDTFEMVQNAYERLVKTYPNDEFVLMGDSAGGGLALAFAQKKFKEKFPIQPNKIILISPWLDLSLKNPEIRRLEDQDLVLSIDALSTAADLYAKGSDKTDYLLSPIYGDAAGLGAIHIFTGTRDILWPDCRKFYEISKKQNPHVYFHEYAQMPHIWLFFPFKEAKDAFHEIVSILGD